MMLRNAAIAAASALAGCALLLSGTAALADGLGAASSEFRGAPALAPDAVTASAGNSISPTPQAAPIYTLNREGFAVSGTVSQQNGIVYVYVNGVQDKKGLIPTGTTSPYPFTGHIWPPSPGTAGALACGTNSVELSNPPIIIQDYQKPTGPSTPSPAPTVPYLVASATLTAQCPAISLNPATITQSAEPAPVLVTGTTFYPGPAVAIAVDGNQVSSATTDGNGGFSTSVTAQGLSCGTHQVTANQFVDALSQTLSASATLTVTCNQARLALDPAVLEPGELTHVTGTGFTPGQPVTLTWRLRGGGPPLLGRASVTANGTGGIAAWLMVMPNDVLGQRQLVATQGGSTATANAVVDGGPMEPSTGDRLIYRSS